MTFILNIMNLIMSILIIVSAYGTYQAMKETDENMKYLQCDSFAYNQEQAPSYCK